MNNYNIEQAMKKLHPGASWSAGETYESLKVHDKAKPSRDDLEAAIASCAVERAAVNMVLDRVLQITAKFSAGEKVAHRAFVEAIKAAFTQGDTALARELITTYPLLADSARQEFLSAL